MHILVAGGAGYIGSHVVLSLLRAGYTPVIADNFVNSDRSVIGRLQIIADSNVLCREIDLTDRLEVCRAFEELVPSAVIHLAGLKSVAESTVDPVHYYTANLGITLNILSAMAHTACKKIIFSSSATVYGEPDYVPIDEEHKVSPINPYGRTKLYQEEIIGDFISAKTDASAVILRYFNPVGADASGLIGEDPNGSPNNLMPLLGDAAAGIRSEIKIFGTDYPTRDGTCERDYIHVSDLAEAHVAALQCQPVDRIEIFNVGTGHGVTVREAIDTYSLVCGYSVPERLGERRAGDAASSVASNEKIARRFSWQPVRSFQDACRDDIKWRSNRSKIKNGETDFVLKTTFKRG